MEQEESEELKKVEVNASVDDHIIIIKGKTRFTLSSAGLERAKSWHSNEKNPIHTLLMQCDDYEDNENSCGIPGFTLKNLKQFFVSELANNKSDPNLPVSNELNQQTQFILDNFNHIVTEAIEQGYLQKTTLF